MLSKQALIAILFAYSGAAFADKAKEDRNHEAPSEQDPLVVHGRKLNQLGVAISASEGSISQTEIEQRPVLRSGEILEFVPGMVVTQHSGSGKANQYFLRGFNLDHGTDFRTTIDSMPVNMRSHGHGQGYTDLNFIVPEFIDQINYQKGPYHAEDGDFSTAGSAHFSTADHLNGPIFRTEIGENGYLRTVAAHSKNSDQHKLLFGVEGYRYDGPWTDVDEDVEKHNVLVKYLSETNEQQYTLTFMGYDNKWNSADQIPSRAVAAQLIDRLGSLDRSVGGKSNRYSISTNWENDTWDFSAYLITSKLELFSNFTYFLDDPTNGDQFEQVDNRQIYGGEFNRKFTTQLGNNHLHHDIGLQIRYDDIENVALYKTKSRTRLSTVREDSLKEYSIGMFWEGRVDLSSSLSANIGLRYDRFDVDVTSNNNANSGTANDDLFSVKGGLQYKLSDHWEGYFNIGQSFHSNDARGATITIDPNTGTPTNPVDLLVRGDGAEVGLRFFDYPDLSFSIGLWLLELDSELLFVGDAGNTEPGRASRRYGVEISAYYWMGEKLSLDMELAWSKGRFTEESPGDGNYIEGALPFVASLGAAWKHNDHWRADFRLRHFGKRTLNSFDSQTAGTFTVANLSATYTVNNWAVDLSLLNLFDSNDHDIDYLYNSRLPGEVLDGIEDIHFHPIEPRTLRVQFRYAF